MKDPVFWAVAVILAVFGTIGMVYGEDKKVTQYEWLGAEILHCDLIMTKTIMVDGDDDESLIINGGVITFIKSNKIKYMIVYTDGLLNIADGKGNILAQFNGQ
ncbi:MAG: hypothetical protein QQN63_01510 [Nitrosopumilus sp.]